MIVDSPAENQSKVALEAELLLEDHCIAQIVSNYTAAKRSEDLPGAK